MAIENELSARLQHAVEYTENNVQHPADVSIPKKGEIVFNSTLTNFKVGDGTTQYSQLTDFITGDTYFNGSGLNLTDHTFSLKYSTSTELGGGKINDCIYVSTDGYTTFASSSFPLCTPSSVTYSGGINIIHTNISEVYTGLSIKIPISYIDNITNNDPIRIEAGNVQYSCSTTPDTIKSTGISAFGTKTHYLFRFPGSGVSFVGVAYDSNISNNPYGSYIMLNDGYYYAPVLPARTSSSIKILGGIKVASNNVSSAGSIASSGTYYPIETTAAGEACVKVPSDGGTDTWRNIKVNNSQILGTGINTGALNLIAGNGISLTSNDGAVTISNNNIFHPVHLDAWMGRTNNNAYSIDTMDAPFYCTDLRSPTYTMDNYHAFPGASSQWGVYDTVNLPEHITLWPCGIHNLNKLNSSNSDNWMAVMMTSWAAGHPMSISIVNHDNRTREWIPLIYTGPLEISGRIYSVSIDLGAAIILHLLNTATYFPFENNQQSEPNIYSLVDDFASNYSIGTTPITFRWFNTTNSNECPNTFINNGSSLMDIINGIIRALEVKNFSGFTQVIDTSIIKEVWDNEKFHAEDDETEGTIAGNGNIFMTWDEILDAGLYTNGVFVCTALPEIHAIQHI